jgi:hypothetical protein
MRPSHPVRHFCALRNQRFFCSFLRSALLVERLGDAIRLTPRAVRHGLVLCREERRIGSNQALSHDLAGSAQDVAFTYTRNQAQEIITRSWNNEGYAWSDVQDTRTFMANGLNQYTAVNGTPYSYNATTTATAT